MSDRFYWAIIDPDTNNVLRVDVTLSDDMAAVSPLYPGMTIARCRTRDEDKAGIGYVYDAATGWFMPPEPELDGIEGIYFDRDLWRWHIPGITDRPVVDTPPEDTENP